MTNKPKTKTAIAAGLVLVGGLIAVRWLADTYFSARGFPLDDAWIHAVYGRSLARSGMLAYNPGEASAGATSILWAAVWAVPHLFTESVELISACIKWSGLLFHATTAGLLATPFLAQDDGDWTLEAAAAVGMALVFFQPDLIAASLSGMEISLTTATAAAFIWAVHRNKTAILGIVSGLAPLARPELSVFCVVFAALYLFDERQRLEHQGTAVASGLLTGWSVIGLTSYYAWQHWLPATFYAKVARQSEFSVIDRLGDLWSTGAHFSLINWNFLIPVALVWSGYVLWTRESRHSRLLASIFAAGLTWLATSAVLTSAELPSAFYFQRYYLPQLPFLLFPLPFVLVFLIRRFASTRLAHAGLAVGIVAAGTAIALDTPKRLDRLENDAHNIDDIQVALGKKLGEASPDQTVWATDAGAIRYFGSAYVVDLVGLNSPEMLTDRARHHLLEHRPDFFEINPGWIGLDDASSHKFPTLRFDASTPWTVTPNPKSNHQALAECKPAGHVGRMKLITGLKTPFKCAD